MTDANGNYVPDMTAPIGLGSVGVTASGVVPVGGSTDQVLAKRSAADYDLKWVTPGVGTAVDFNLDGTVDPSSSPSDTSKSWLYTNTVTGTLWCWKAGGSSWQQLV